MNNDTVKKNIRKARLERKISLEQMASSLGISVTALKKIETGRTRIINEHVLDMPELLGISDIDFFFGERQGSDQGAVLQDIRNQMNDKVRILTDEYEAKLHSLRKEIAMKDELLNEKDDNIRNLKSLIAILEKKAGR